MQSQVAANAAFDPLAAGSASTTSQPADPTAVENRQDQKEEFLTSSSTETRNSGNLQMSASQYQAMAGTVIAGALVTGIKFDLPGDGTDLQHGYRQVPADPAGLTNPGQVYQPGRIGTETRIGGEEPDHSSGQIFAHARQPDWHRPSGLCRSGRRCGRHWDRIFAGVMLTTLRGVGAELEAPENRQGGDRVVIGGRDSLQDTLNQVGQEVTRRNLNIQPTLTSRPGLPVLISVNSDLVFRPY